MIELHTREVGETALDFGLVESAVLRPQQVVGRQDAYPDIHTKAAVMMFSLVRNHPFLDGNKRTAALATIVFYNLNGFLVLAEQGELVGLALDIAHGIIDVPEIAGSLKRWVSAIEFPEEFTE